MTCHAQLTASGLSPSILCCPRGSQLPQPNSPHVSVAAMRPTGLRKLLPASGAGTGPHHAVLLGMGTPLCVPTVSVGPGLPSRLSWGYHFGQGFSHLTQHGFALFLRGAFSFPILTQMSVFDIFLAPCLSQDAESCVSSARLMCARWVRADSLCLSLSAVLHHSCGGRGALWPLPARKALSSALYPSPNPQRPFLLPFHTRRNHLPFVSCCFSSLFILPY